MSSPELRPLLPLSARSISWTDILFPPVCLACALALHILYNPQFGDNQRHSHLYRMTTQHARFLPEESKHAFHYNTIHIGVDLDALERKHLDIGDRWFAYNPRRWTLLGLNDLMFSSLPTSSSELKAAARVRRHLLERGIPAGHMDNIYTIAMPTFAGFEGINPLVVHYCYSTSAHRSLRVVVLEVHNTFEERHIYVLQVGKNEDERPSSGHTHQWTFPRAFHVSPFNDRSGFYCVSLIDPLSQNPTEHPQYSIKILLLNPDLSKKLMATLSGVGQPLNESSILAAALTLPLSLFLTSIRISYQAFILHYLKKLKVYAKPPLFVGQTVQPINAVDAKQAQQGSIHWIQPSRDQIYLRSLFEAILSERVKQSHIPVRITIEPADFTQTSFTISNTEIATEAESQFTLRFHSYHAFQELFMAPSLQHAFQVSIANGWIEVNQPQIFVDFFNKHCPHNHHGPMRKAIQQSRRLHHRWSSGEWTQADEWPLHAASWRLLGILLKVLLSDVMSYVVFKLLRAEFVQGESPWDTCRRLGGPATVQGGSIQSESERDGSYHFRASSVLQHGEVLGCNDHRL